MGRFGQVFRKRTSRARLRRPPVQEKPATFPDLKKHLTVEFSIAGVCGLARSAVALLFELAAQSATPSELPACHPVRRALQRKRLTISKSTSRQCRKCPKIEKDTRKKKKTDFFSFFFKTVFTHTHNSFHACPKKSQEEEDSSAQVRRRFKPGRARLFRFWYSGVRPRARAVATRAPLRLKMYSQKSLAYLTFPGRVVDFSVQFGNGATAKSPKRSHTPTFNSKQSSRPRCASRSALSSARSFPSAVAACMFIFKGLFPSPKFPSDPFATF